MILKGLNFVIFIYKFIKMCHYEFNSILIKIFHLMSKVIRIILCFSTVFADNVRDL